jgi:hypothetical protein
MIIIMVYTSALSEHDRFPRHINSAVPWWQLLMSKMVNLFSDHDSPSVVQLLLATIKIHSNGRHSAVRKILL